MSNCDTECPSNIDGLHRSNIMYNIYMRRMNKRLLKAPQNIVMTFITTVWNMFAFAMMLGFAILVSPILIIIFLPVAIIGLLVLGLMFSVAIAILIAAAKIFTIIGLILLFYVIVQKIWRVKP